MRTVKVDINGESLGLRPSFDAVLSIEEELGKSFFLLAQKAAAGDFGAKDMIAIIYHGLRCNAQTKDRQAIIDAISDAGMAKYIDAIGEFMTVALEGGKQVGKLQPQ